MLLHNGVSVVLDYVETRTHVVPGFSDSDLSWTKKVLLIFAGILPTGEER